MTSSSVLNSDLVGKVIGALLVLAGWMHLAWTPRVTRWYVRARQTRLGRLLLVRYAESEASTRLTGFVMLGVGALLLVLAFATA